MLFMKGGEFEEFENKTSFELFYTFPVSYLIPRVSICTRYVMRFKVKILKSRGVSKLLTGSVQRT